jgi:hypothetical protein
VKRDDDDDDDDVQAGHNHSTYTFLVDILYLDDNKPKEE